MGEKANLVEQPTAAAVGHHTVERSVPGTRPRSIADTDSGKEKKKAKAKGPSQPFWGAVDFGDGYEMQRTGNGTWYLVEEDGKMGEWDEGREAWADVDNNYEPMPKGWGKGHKPGEGLPSRSKK